MARPLLVDGKLPMQIFTNHGYRYAVTRTSVRKPDGTYNHPQRIWGTVDDSLTFTPNERYLALPQEEKDGIMIPVAWHIASRQPAAVRGRPSYSGACSSLLYGHTWFLEMLASQCGLRDDLEHVFEDAARADQILSLAYYSLVESASYSHMENSQRISWYPSGKALAPCDITRLTQAISEDDKQAMFRCRKARATGKRWLGIDSTSFTCLGESLADAKRGKNKEHDLDDQINMLVVYDLDGAQPVYYRKMPGNIPDTRTMRVTLQELQACGFSNLCFVFDRGYVSEEVLEMLVKNHCKFVMMAKVADSQIRRAIKSLKQDEMASHCNWIDKHGTYGKVFDYKFDVTVKGERTPVDTMKFCLFFDPEWQGEKKKRLDAKVSEMERQLENIKADGQRLDEADIAAFGEYFELKLTAGKKLKSYELEEDRLSKEIALTGFFAVITNCMSPSRHDLSEILDIYGLRPEQEKAFMFVKSEQEGRRFRTSTETSTDGRIFIQFIALILNCIIYRKYTSSETLQKLFPSRKHMLDELRSIRLIRHPKRAKMITEIVGRQIDVFKEFKMPVPLHLLPAAQRKAYAEMLAGKMG